MHSDDQELVAQAAAGCGDAFGELVLRHSGHVRRLARQAARDHADADDLVQETLIRAFRGARRFRGDSNFRTWLHRIAENVIRTRQRKESAECARGWPQHQSERGAFPFDSIPCCEDLETTIVRRRTIAQALAQLPPAARHAIILRDVQGLEYQEIAGRLGVPIGTIESRIFRARRRLRPILRPLIGGRVSSSSCPVVHLPDAD